ncbi:hypothetical protein PR202_ga07077 [Eleusine coracana subsp. coracana]|uniref:Uncharacterized protein n=1 Tax=Eleusine coracana subsp. coracana TaxID=191504 RepID=A0AAV5BXQ3_ELECO|nr:hypothetical protein QOZ80_2AG0108080 [Eleusine coracana subsp. coracana]GJM90767.1 hypothetical protein PR202_ga07077 [Eleusine coracana subsp. coracana]
MGNCVQSSHYGAGGGQMQKRRSEEAAVTEDHHQGPPASAPPPSVVKVKMVLTKGELGWLVARLKSGDRRLEDVLQEMVARKKREDGWRPSLESIVESPAETATISSDSLS